MGNLTYYQANQDGGIELGIQPEGPTKSEIISILTDALSCNGWEVDDVQSSSQPYIFKLASHQRTLDVYIYCWRISNGGETHVHMNREFK